MDAFDADCLIYAAIRDHPWGGPVAALLRRVPGSDEPGGQGSVILIPELLSKPLREKRSRESAQLAYLLSRLELRPVDRRVATLASGLGARYRLTAADAVHLATAVQFGAARFITNNRRDFKPEQITEVAITYPDSL